MTKPFPPPLSGPLLGHLIDAFDLRRLDQLGVLTKRNSRRYLAGERVSPEAEADVHAAVAEAIIKADLLPPGLAGADLLVPPPPDVAASILPKITTQFVVQLLVSRGAASWDALAGALRRAAAAMPVAFPEQAAGACLRLVAIDIAVRLVALLWLSRATEEDPIPVFWIEERGTSAWLRALHEACSPALSRDELAKHVRVHAHTLDGWLDAEVRPTDENLMDLAHCFAERGLGTAEDLLRELRLVFGARAIFKKIEGVVGKKQAIDICGRVAVYANEMLRFPRQSMNAPAEKDIKMQMAFAVGTLGRGPLSLHWVESMLNHVWRNEPDPVWRTSIKATTRSWLDHLQEIAAKLGPTDTARVRAAFGAPPPREALTHITYMTQASKEELARDPRFAWAMAVEAQQGGKFGALELKLQGTEAARRGDLLGAIDKLRVAATEDPLDAEIHFRLGCFLWQVGDVAAGLNELEISIQLDPDWDRARVEIAIVLLNEGRDDEALRRLLESRAALKEPCGWLLFNLAYAYERNGKLAGAIQSYEELLAIEPDNAEALDRVAHLYFVAKERVKGRDAAKRAAQLGVPTVFHAIEQGLYAKGAPARRPPHHPSVVPVLHFQTDPQRMPPPR